MSGVQSTGISLGSNLSLSRLVATLECLMQTSKISKLNSTSNGAKFINYFNGFWYKNCGSTELNEQQRPAKSLICIKYVLNELLDLRNLNSKYLHQLKLYRKDSCNLWFRPQICMIVASLDMAEKCLANIVALCSIQFSDSMFPYYLWC